MTLVLIMGLIVGFQTGESVAKKELIDNGKYFCRVDDKGTKRCYEVIENLNAKQENYLRNN